MLCAALLAGFAGIAFGDGYGIRPGQYTGRWSGQSAEGSIDIHLEGTDKKLEAARVTFTYEGEEIKTQLREMKQAGNSIEIRYEFEIQGMPLISELKGTLEGKKLSGTYATTARDGGTDVDNGTWWADKHE